MHTTLTLQCTLVLSLQRALLTSCQLGGVCECSRRSALRLCLLLGRFLLQLGYLDGGLALCRGRRRCNFVLEALHFGSVFVAQSTQLARCRLPHALQLLVCGPTRLKSHLGDAFRLHLGHGVRQQGGVARHQLLQRGSHGSRSRWR